MATKQETSPIQDSAKVVLAELIKLTGVADRIIQRPMRNGDREDVVALLRAVGHFNKALLECLSDTPIPDEVSIPDPEPKTEPIPIDCLTLSKFGPLLRKRVDEYLPNKNTLRLKTIFQRPWMGLIEKALQKQGVTGLDIPRNTAVEAVAQGLTFPFKDQKDEEGLFNRTRLMQTNACKASFLDQIAEAVGYDWKANPEVNRNDAKCIRGLSRLEEIKLRGSKTALVQAQ